jgi:streptogramin lyase
VRHRLGGWYLASTLVVVACQAGPPATSGPPAAASPDQSAAPTVASTTLAERLQAEIPVAGAPDWPQAAFDSIWVLAPDLPIRGGGGSPSLVRIDPTTNAIAATIELPDRLCQGFVASDDAMWVCSTDGLVRVDPSTNDITTSVAIEGLSRTFYQPAFGGGAVWALGSTASASDTVIRLDLATETSTSQPLSAPIGGLAYGFDALWLTLTREGSLVRLDPDTGESEVMAEGLAAPAAVAVGSDSLWVALHGDPEEMARPGDTQLVRVDPSTGDIRAEFAVGGSPQGGVLVWAGEGGVLVRSTSPWLVRIDEVTNDIVDTILAEPPIQGPVTTGFGSIWTVNVERDVVYRVAPAAGG